MAVLIVKRRRRPEAKEAGRQRLLILQMLGDKGTVSDDGFESRGRSASRRQGMNQQELSEGVV